MIEHERKHTVTKIVEKPVLDITINTGLYIANKSILEYINNNQHIHMTDVIEQLLARSKKVTWGASGLFAAIKHEEIRTNYFFVFYSERMHTTWIM